MENPRLKLHADALSERARTLSLLSKQLALQIQGENVGALAMDTLATISEAARQLRIEIRQVRYEMRREHVLRDLRKKGLAVRS